MSISRRLPRRGWTLLTAILAVVAVITALVVVPWGKAGADESQPSDFDPNTTLGKESEKKISDPTRRPADYDWGLLVWAGQGGESGHGAGGGEKNDVGWAWCLEPYAFTPLETDKSYERAKAKNFRLTGDTVTP